MKIKCVKTSIDNPDKYIINSVMEGYLFIGNIYWVYGLRFSNNIIYFYIFNHGHLVEVPAELFEVIENKISTDWEIKFWSDKSITFWPCLFYKADFLEKFAEREKKERSEFEILRTAIEQPDLIIHVYNKKDKRYLYLVIDQFISGEIDEKGFCNEYRCAYEAELDHLSLTEKEALLFFELSEVVSQFSDCQDNNLLDTNVFINKVNFRKKILEIKYTLQSKEQT